MHHVQREVAVSFLVIRDHHRPLNQRVKHPGVAGALEVERGPPPPHEPPVQQHGDGELVLLERVDQKPLHPLLLRRIQPQRVRSRLVLLPWTRNARAVHVKASRVDEVLDRALEALDQRLAGGQVDARKVHDDIGLQFAYLGTEKARGLRVQLIPFQFHNHHLLPELAALLGAMGVVGLRLRVLDDTHALMPHLNEPRTQVAAHLTASSYYNHLHLKTLGPP
mmetsp:Transcript_4752/g.10968  ORF Transcript_4752/g.10968 Transcript_4752/m.10968 type:complete len:222 (-) Transcript_4752:26-691(-)